MKVGLVGFAAAGKSTVFAALSGVDPSAGKGGLGTIRVPDERVDRLSALCHPRKTTYAEIVFQDFAAGSFGPSSISASVLGQMRNLDVLAEVVGCFAGEDPSVLRSQSAAFHAELLLADQAVIEKRLDRLRREKGDPMETETLTRCLQALEEDRELSALELDEQHLSILSPYKFLTLKPRLVLANVSEAEIAVGNGTVQAQGHPVLVMSAPIEWEISRLEPAERAEFLADLGLGRAAGERFVQACYALLDLIAFLTAGEDEVRAWPLRRGSSALEAAGKIHSDIARGFIRAEIIGYDDYIELGGEAGCRHAGKARVEGKDYIIADGDIAHFRFNV